VAIYRRGELLFLFLFLNSLIVQDLRREDESPDEQFYSQPRLVMHIDDPAIEALKRHYAKVLPKDSVLDICSSWTSHFPEAWKADRYSFDLSSPIPLQKAFKPQ